jgi:hypothetical protein
LKERERRRKKTERFGNNSLPGATKPITKSIFGGDPMAIYSNPLDHVKVAAPCSADWNSMIGDERVRFCGQCSFNVYNLSGMTRDEAEDLIRRAEGRLCVRFYRRSDGTILTDNCPVGLSAIKRRVSRVAGAAIAALLSFFTGLGLHNALFSEAPYSGEGTIMGAMTMGEMEIPAPPVPEQSPEINNSHGEFVMGKIAPAEVRDEIEKSEDKVRIERRSLPIIKQNR